MWETILMWEKWNYHWWLIQMWFLTSKSVNIRRRWLYDQLRRSLMNKLIGLIHAPLKKGLITSVYVQWSMLFLWSCGIYIYIYIYIYTYTCAWVLTRSRYCNITRLSAVIVGFVISVWLYASVRLPLRIRLDLIFQ